MNVGGGPELKPIMVTADLMLDIVERWPTEFHGSCFVDLSQKGS